MQFLQKGESVVQVQNCRIKITAAASDYLRKPNLCTCFVNCVYDYCTELCVRTNHHILSGRSWFGCIHARHGGLSLSSGARAAGNPRTKPSSLHLSACACGCPAAPPPGNLEHATHTHTHTQMSIHGMINVLEPRTDRFKKDLHKFPTAHTMWSM